MMLSTFKKLIFLLVLFYANALHAADSLLQININIVNASSVSESSGPLKYAVTIDSSPSFFMGNLKVHYVTVDNSAKKVEDYTYTEGDLTFTKGGAKTQYILVPVVDNSNYELDERVKVFITESSLFYETINDTAYGTIHDDDVQAFELNRFNSNSVKETDVDQEHMVRAYFNQKTTSALTVTYHTEDVSTVAGSDYVEIKSKTVPVSMGVKYIDLPVTIKGDLTPEKSETFKMLIDSISVGTVTDKKANVNINDDDTIEVDVSCNDALEGNIGESNDVECRIFLANNKPYPAGETDFTVDYSSADGAKYSAIAGDDYVAVSGKVTFTVGDKEHTVLIPTIGDNDVEPNEKVKLLISGSSYIIDHSSEAIIKNDDGTYPEIHFDVTDVWVDEGNSSTTNVEFHLTLDSAADDNTSFEFYTKDNSAKVADNDYVELPHKKRYVIPSGETNATIIVQVNGDTKIEEDESFYLYVTNGTHITMTKLIATGHIRNDDGEFPQISFIDTKLTTLEGDSGKRELNITLSLDKPAFEDSTFEYYTQDGSAKALQGDYDAIGSTPYTFPKGESNVTFSVYVNGDKDVELDEEFYFKIKKLNNLKEKSTKTLTIAIENDDKAHVIKNVGEFRFDECGGDEWKKDYSFLANNAVGTLAASNIIDNDAKTYMCSSLNGSNKNVTIPHNSAYEVDEGTFSIMLYDHHNTWNSSWLIQKGAFKMNVKSVAGNKHKGTITAKIQGNEIATNEVYFTTTAPDDGDHDTQWIVATFTFGNEGMKLYINGVLKGTHAYTGGISSILNDIKMTKISGYFDEFYIFDGQMNADEVSDLYNNIIDNKNIDGTARDCGCGLPPDPDAALTCDSTMYISSTVNRENGKTGRTWLHSIDTSTNPFDFNVVDSAGAAEKYNALAYAESGDKNTSNYIFALEHRNLLKLTQTGKVINLGQVSGLPSDLDTYQLFAGAIYNSIYYVAGWGYATKEVYKIDLTDKSVSTINLTEAISINDFSFSKDGKKLYGILSAGEFVSINVADGNVTKVGTPHTGYEFDSTFSDKNNRFFANDGNGNGFFEFNVKTGKKRFISNSQPATFNDGANCLNASLVFNDYGDAPKSYGRARHNIANGVFLGLEVDHDAKFNASIDALGDDTNGIDDEDGVTLSDGSEINGIYFALDKLHTLKVTLAKEAYLKIWIDKDVNGKFNNKSDLIYSSSTKLSAGVHNITFTLPSTLPNNTLTYLRARVSSNSKMRPNSLEVDGEVEDYAIKLGTKALKGKFNIERTDSASFPLMTDKRNAWYTQYVGRDFDYSIVFYEEDFSAEKNISNVTLKIELMNMDATPPTAMYQYEFHVPDTFKSSRINIIKTIPKEDLANLPATRNALFRVTYGLDANGGVVQENCLVDKALCSKQRTDLAKDDFVIRPEHFYIAISDTDKLIKENNNSIPKPLRVAAGYDYNLTIIASSVKGNKIPSIGYETPLKTALEFLTKGTCADESNVTVDVDFKDGLFSDSNFTHSNVGEYLLTLKDSVWTKVDADRGQCKVDSSAISANPNLPSGCDIDTISDVNFLFYPYQFKVDLAMNNLPTSTHSDFIYMSDMNSTDNNVSLQFVGTITAEDKDATPTTNFTYGCVAENIVLTPNATVRIDDGIIVSSGFPTRIRTAKHPTQARENVSLTRMALYNNETLNGSHFSDLTDVSMPLNITSDKFLDTRNGVMTLDLRYNIKKHPSLPVNPIQITFNSLDVSSPTSWSLAKGKTKNDPYIPFGTKNLGGVRNFYFAQVAPDKILYPRINFNKTKSIRTPLNVDIFCNASEAYCTQTKIFDNTAVESSPRKQEGWYLSVNHDGVNDGVVTSLIAAPNIVSTTAAPIVFTKGRNGVVSTKFNNCSSPKSVITINSSPALSYKPNGIAPYYVVECTLNDASEWTGIGNAGNILDTKSNVNFEGKMDW